MTPVPAVIASLKEQFGVAEFPPLFSLSTTGERVYYLSFLVLLASYFVPSST